MTEHPASARLLMHTGPVTLADGRTGVVKAEQFDPHRVAVAIQRATPCEDCPMGGLARLVWADVLEDGTIVARDERPVTSVD